MSARSVGELRQWNKDDGDLRRLALAALVSLLLHLLLAWLVLVAGVAAPPKVEEEIRVPLTFDKPPEPLPQPEEPPPPPETAAKPPAEERPVDEKPVQDKAEEETEKKKPEPPPDSRLFGWNSEGEIKRDPDRPPGPETGVHAPPKPEGGEDFQPGPTESRSDGSALERSEEVTPAEPAPVTEPEPSEEQPHPPAPVPQATPKEEPGSAPEELPPDRPDAPAPRAPSFEPEPLPPRQPTRSPRDQAARPRRPLDFDTEIQGGYFGDLKFDSSDYNWSEYSTKAYFAIYRAWLRELYARVLHFQRDQSLLGLPDLDGEVRIHFVFHRDGHVDSIEILAPSPMPTLDRASSASLARAVLPPLPEDYPRDQEGMTFRFTLRGFPDAHLLERQLKFSRYRGEF